MMPWLKKRAFRKIVPFWEKTHKWPSDVLVSKIIFICGKYSSKPFSNDFTTSFRPASSLIRLGSIDKSNKTVCADIITCSNGKKHFPFSRESLEWPNSVHKNISPPKNQWKLIEVYANNLPAKNPVIYNDT